MTLNSLTSSFTQLLMLKNLKLLSLLEKVFQLLLEQVPAKFILQLRKLKKLLKQAKELYLFVLKQAQKTSKVWLLLRVYLQFVVV